ncbi:unnamed protein product [Porites evermanni]|uniref:Uncharacterized protein n=1 Tax=Porites evermanni TaxID=104178 RepID=A0ABN8M2K8_9CNID|nr:unnamed protein product [Porites evermanni]
MMLPFLVIMSLSNLCFTKSISHQQEPLLDNQTISHQSVAHNGTAGGANNPCLYDRGRKWDSCRQKYVQEVYCHSTHAVCYGALAKGYSYPACKVVIGYPQAKYISKCAALSIDCQCAA